VGRVTAVLATEDFLVTSCDANEVKVWRRPESLLSAPPILSDEAMDGDDPLNASNVSISSIAMFGLDSPSSSPAK
jgi:hypothetical protein